MVLAESSSESSSSIGAAVGFAFRLAEGFAVASRGSLEAGKTLLGIGRVVVLAAEARFRKLRSDVGIGFVVVKLG